MNLFASNSTKCTFLHRINDKFNKIVVMRANPLRRFPIICMERCPLFVLMISNICAFDLKCKILNYPRFNIRSVFDKDAYHANIKLLRISTGLGTAECVEALKKTNNDVRKAISLLSNVEYENKMPTGDLIPLYEGVSTTSIGKKYASIIELRCQTSFVSCNSMFGNLAANIASAITAIADANNSKNVNFQDIFDKKCLVCNDSLDKTANRVKRSLQETILFTRFGIIEKPENSHFSAYSHKTNHSCSSEVGPSTSLVSFTTKNSEIVENYNLKSDTSCIARGERCIYHLEVKSRVKGSEFAREIATHIVAASPTGMVGFIQFSHLMI